jgi:Protein of unknown function C-terminus (DUF2399)
VGAVTIGDTGVEETSDGEILTWCRAKCQHYTPQEKTLRIWLAILRAFDAIGVPMTVRQMFYALVARAIIEKTEQGYEQVGYHLLNMRRQKVVPYGFIADNTRYMRKPRSYASLEEFLQSSQHFYRKSVWETLPDRVEIWIEKDALAGVVYDVTEPWDVPLMVTRGFPSETFVYEAVEAINAAEKPTYVYYFGDFDPSGVAIATGTAAKMQRWTGLITFTHVAVTPEQIVRMNLPTRPTKKSDSRAKSWTAESVELDAIPANILRQLVEDCIRIHVPAHHLEWVQDIAQLERETLKRMTEDWNRQS